MANNNAPFGFKPIKSLSGNIRAEYKGVASSSSRIGKGDLVELTSAGNIQRATSATSVGPWYGVSLADTGVISAAISKHPVCTDPNMIYEIQSVATAALATTNLNAIYKVDCSTAPNSSTGISANGLTNTAATATNGVRAIKLVDAPDNDTSARYVRVEVRLNSTNAAPGTAGV